MMPAVSAFLITLPLSHHNLLNPRAKRNVGLGVPVAPKIDVVVQAQFNTKRRQNPPTKLLRMPHYILLLLGQEQPHLNCQK